MIRRFMMWMGFSPVTGEVLLWSLPDGNWKAEMRTEASWWATEEDITVFRVTVLIELRNLLGGRDVVKIVNERA